MTDFGQRHAAVLPRFPRLRLAAAALILGAAFAGAAVVYGHRVAVGFHGCPPNVPVSCAPGAYQIRPGWVGPTALGISLLGVALAAGALVTARRNPS